VAVFAFIEAIASRVDCCLWSYVADLFVFLVCCAVLCCTAKPFIKAGFDMTDVIINFSQSFSYSVVACMICHCDRCWWLRRCYFLLLLADL
jgi:hypothetical protein